MKNGGLRKLFALVTALTMLFVTLAGTALEEELPAKVTLNSGDTLELEGSLLTVNENGAQLISDGSGDISLLINGEILSLSEAASVGYIYIQALTIDASAGDTVTAEIGEGITATVENDPRGANGAVIDATGGSKVEVTVDGPVESHPLDWEGKGLIVRAEEGSTVSVKTEGDIASVDQGEGSGIGVIVEARDEGTVVSVEADGNITAGSGYDENHGVYAYAEDGSVLVRNTGDIESTGNGTTTQVHGENASAIVMSEGGISGGKDAVYTYVSGENNTSAVIAEGPVFSEGDGPAVTMQDEGTNSTVIFGTDSELESEGKGIQMIAEGSGESSVMSAQTGSVTAQGVGIEIELGGEGGSVISQTSGGIEADAQYWAAGFDISSIGGEKRLETTVVESVLVHSEESDAVGIKVEGAGEGAAENQLVMDASVGESIHASSDTADAAGIKVIADGPDSSGLEVAIDVGENVIARADNGIAEGVILNSEMDANANSDLTVETGEVMMAVSEQGSAAGIVISAEQTGESTSQMTATAEGGVYAITTEGDAIGIDTNILLTDESSSTVTAVSGSNVLALTENGEAVGAMVYADTGDSAEADVTVRMEGDTIAATETGGATGADVYVVTANSSEASVTVQMDGDTIAETETGDATGVDIYAETNDSSAADVTLLMGGSVSAETETGDAEGISIRVDGYDTGTAELSVITAGDVAAAAENGNAMGVGIYSAAYDEARPEISAVVEGDIKAESEKTVATGLEVQQYGKGKTDVQTGGIEAKGAGFSSGVAVLNHSGEVTAEVNGDIVAASSETKGSDGVFISNSLKSNSEELGTVEVEVKGDISSDGQGITVRMDSAKRDMLPDVTPEVKESELVSRDYYLDENEEVDTFDIYYNEEGDYYYDSFGTVWKETDLSGDGGVAVTVTGDVSGEDTGLSLSGNSLAPVDIIIDGTLSGGESAVLVMDEKITENLTLTVWEVKPGETGNVVDKEVSKEDGTRGREAMEEVAKEIQYIIRLRQPDEGGALTMSGTRDYEGYQVANEGDNVVMRLNLNEGYELINAYGDVEQQVSLMQDAQGHYYLIVPRGGGVELSVRLRKIVTDTYSTLTFDPNGGTFYGITSTYFVSVKDGTQYALPEAPAKEGSRFLGWYGSMIPASDENWKAPEEGNPQLKQAKDYVPVYQNRIYTAIWAEEAAEETPANP